MPRSRTPPPPPTAATEGGGGGGGGTAAASTAAAAAAAGAPAPSSTSDRKRRSRRSGGNAATAVVAPGGGTATDVKSLSRNLGLAPDAVSAIMACGGGGVASRSRSHGSADPGGGGGGAGGSSGAAAAAAPGASAWADFMDEEGFGGGGGGGAAGGGGEPAAKKAKADGANGTAAATAKKAAAAEEEPEEAPPVADESTPREYVLPILPPMARPGSSGKAEASDGKYAKPGRLAQTGTLDSSIPGRSKSSAAATPRKFDLGEPTFLPVMDDGGIVTDILKGSKVAFVATSSTSCHSVAVTVDGTAYGWGRNESAQLGTGSPSPFVPLPTKLEGPWEDKPLVGGATGKSHTVVIDGEGNAYACGNNKYGQCGVNTSAEDVNKFRRCVLVGDGKDAEGGGGGVEVVQASCGENFSVLLSSTGHVYTAGLAEYGQLGNGETGEYFIAANKLGFANSTKFERRPLFVQSESDARNAQTGYATVAEDKDKIKFVELADSADIVIGSVSCGKNHAVAVEAPTTTGHAPRVFTWGCGDYGCLGHGIQADEYTPRLVGTLRGPLFAGNHVVRAVAGASCSMVLTKRGHVYYWGKHRSVGEATMRPTLVEALANNGHVVTALAGGFQTVFCSTKNAVTVSWGMGPNGELGYGHNNPKSSAKPKFVEKLDSCLVTNVSCGYGHTLFLISDEDEEDTKAMGKITKLEEEDVADWSASVAGSGGAGNGEKKNGRGRPKK